MIDSHAKPYEFNYAGDVRNSATKENVRVNSEVSKLPAAANQWPQQAPGPIINTVSGRAGANINGRSAFLETESDYGFVDLVTRNPICSEEIHAVGESPLPLEAENELISLTNPSRIDPKIFMRIPDALEAIKRNYKRYPRPINKGYMRFPVRN